MPLPHCADLQVTAPDGHTRPRRFGSNEGSKKSRYHVILYFLVAVFLLPFSALSDRSKRPSLGKDNAKIRELISRKHFTDAANLITRTSPEAWLVKGHLYLRDDHTKKALSAFAKVKKLPKELNDFFS